MVRRGCLWCGLATAAQAQSGNLAAGAQIDITVAEVKPHFECTHTTGKQKVREHVQGKIDEHFGLIALIQFEISFSQKNFAYHAFGAVCRDDSTVVLYNTYEFEMVKTIGDYTHHSDYFHDMPWLGSGSKPSTNGHNCMADPNDHGVGSRAWTAAVLKHHATGREVCVLSATFPHCGYQWGHEFTEPISHHCSDRPLIVIADTNAGCESHPFLDSMDYDMTKIADHQKGIHWGTCHDPATSNYPTCCHDSSHPGSNHASYWYDRTALCNDGGYVAHFDVKKDYVCETSYGEHKFTTAVVHLHHTTTAAPPVFNQYSIEHRHSHKCVGIDHHTIQAGPNLVVVPCADADDQGWSFDVVSGSLKVIGHTDLCVAVPHLEKGQKLELQNCLSPPDKHQLFGYDENEGTIYASASSDATLCVDVQGGGANDVNLMWLWDCWDGHSHDATYDDQLFTLHHPHAALVV